MANEIETVEQICEQLKVLGPFAFKSGNVVGEILAAHKCELDAKDAEISRLKDKIDWLSFRVDVRNTLIKGLADELDENSSQYCGHYGCHDCEGKDGCKTYELIKKAREILGVAAETQDKEEK